MSRDKISSLYKRISDLGRLVVYLKLKNNRLKERILKQKEVISGKNEELKLYINKYLENEQRWAALSCINKEINSTLTMEDIFNFVSNEMCNLLDIDLCLVCTKGEFNNKYTLQHEIKSGYEDKAEYIKNFLENGFCLDAEAEMKKDVIGKILNKNLQTNYTAIPLMNMSKLFGIIFIYKEGKKITNEHFQVLDTAADNISTALVNAYLYSKMKQNNDRKLTFLTNMSHEFKTPLNAIIGFSSLMYSAELPREKQIRYHSNIIKASKHLLQVVEYTMDMARTETNKIILHYESFSPSDVTVEVLSVLEELIISKSIQLSTTLDNSVIIADKRRFRQVVYNLVSNAIKYNKENGIIDIRTSVKDEMFYFSVKDSGRGISYDLQNKIFEFFTPVDLDGEEKNASGVGLSICKTLIDLHNGQISFSSEPDKGTVFSFYIPTKPEQSSDVVESQKTV